MFDTRKKDSARGGSGNITSLNAETDKPLQLAEGITGSRQVEAAPEKTPSPANFPARPPVSREEAAAATRARAVEKDEVQSGGAAVTIHGRSSAVGPNAQNVNGGVHRNLP